MQLSKIAWAVTVSGIVLVAVSVVLQSDDIRRAGLIILLTGSGWVWTLRIRDRT